MNITDVFVAGVDTPKALKAIAKGITNGTIATITHIEPSGNPEKQVTLVFTQDSQAEEFIKETGIKTDVYLGNNLKYHLLVNQPIKAKIGSILNAMGHPDYYIIGDDVWVIVTR